MVKTSQYSKRPNTGSWAFGGNLPSQGPQGPQGPQGQVAAPASGVQAPQVVKSSPPVSSSYVPPQTPPSYVPQQSAPTQRPAQPQQPPAPQGTGFDNNKPISRTGLFTIPVGEKMYNGSDNQIVFGPNGFVIDDDNYVEFTNDYNRALASIGDCVGHPNGHIHWFEVITPIDRLFFIDPTQMETLKKDEVKTNYCQGSPIPGERINGVGYAPNVNQGVPATSSKTVYLCDPNRFLKYLGFTKCLDGVSPGFMTNFQTYWANNA